MSLRRTPTRRWRMPLPTVVTPNELLGPQLCAASSLRDIIYHLGPAGRRRVDGRLTGRMRPLSAVSVCRAGSSEHDVMNFGGEFAMIASLQLLLEILRCRWLRSAVVRSAAGGAAHRTLLRDWYIRVRLYGIPYIYVTAPVVVVVHGGLIVDKGLTAARTVTGQLPPTASATPAVGCAAARPRPHGHAKECCAIAGWPRSAAE